MDGQERTETRRRRVAIDASEPEARPWSGRSGEALGIGSAGRRDEGEIPSRAPGLLASRRDSPEVQGLEEDELHQGGVGGEGMRHLLVTRRAAPGGGAHLGHPTRQGRLEPILLLGPPSQGLAVGPQPLGPRARQGSRGDLPAQRRQLPQAVSSGSFRCIAIFKMTAIG